MECQSKWNVTRKEMHLKIDCLKMKCHSNWSVTQNVISLKMECHSKWNVTQNGAYSHEIYYITTF